MPELPELEVYRRNLQAVLVGRVVRGVQVVSPFVLRTAEPPLEVIVGQPVSRADRLGKWLDIVVGQRWHVMVHLMQAGRLQWVRKERLRRRDGCLELVFEQGWRLQMSEPGRRKQASVHLVRDPAELGGPSGLDPLGPQFTCQALLAAARRRNRQLKGLLTDQREIAGIGNAYSDEILHAARLSPLQLTANLDQAAITRLHEAIVTTLRGWIDRISRQVGSAMPVNEQRWRRQMAVHGKYGQACGRCGQPIQRISYAETETHYCPTCQTGGRILADRRLSRLLR